MTTAETSFTQTEYSDEQGMRICPCIEIIAFTDARLSEGPHAGLLNFYEAFRQRFGAQMKWYRTNTDDHFKKIKAGKLDMVPFWFEDKRSKQETLLGVALKPGELEGDMQVPSFKFFCEQVRNPSGVFHMTLPLGAGFETLEGMLPIVHEALADFPLLSGYVGYTVYWDTLDFRFEKNVFNQHMPRAYMRHPGLSLADPTYPAPLAVEGLVGVSWLTLLGPQALAKLGGIETLEGQLSEPIEVHTLACQGGGALIVAGPRPLVGDLNAGDDLPLYKAVGHAVRKARFPHQFYKSLLSNDVAQAWFLRFFGKDE